MIIEQNSQNNLAYSDEDPEKSANAPDDFMDFNALNANNFSDEEENAQAADDISGQNEDFGNQNAEDDEQANKNSENVAEAFNAENQLRSNIQPNNANFDNNIQNTKTDNNSREEEEEEKEKTQKSNTNKTNANRTLENKQTTNRQNINNHNKNYTNTNTEENEIDKARKQEILSLLLNTEIKPKAEQKRDESLERKQKTENLNLNKAKKYQHIESKYKKENLENDPLYKAGPQKFFIKMDLENPEFKSDNQNVQRKILLSTKNASESEKDKIIRKLLFQDIEKQKKIVEVAKVTNSDIKNKVSYYLNKRQKNLDEIESLKDEMVMRNCTFQPEFVAEKLFPEKREFKTFLEDQKNHLKRVHDKVEKVNFITYYK